MGRKIIYWCPTIQKPTGGVRVLYQHCQILNEIYGHSQVFHWENADFECDWFSHDANFKRDWVFNKSNDFSIIPEMYAARLGAFMRENSLKYAIFVQNHAFVLFDGLYTSPQAVKDVYANASLIITISDLTTRFIKYTFTDIPHDKILQLRPSIQGCFIGQKENIITCMPRKLPFHGQFIEQLALHMLPDGWRLMHLDSMPQLDVFEHLSKSSIYISLSDIEGLGLPPIEAALSGNIVIGYTGVGGDEYFKEPQFQAVTYGDFVALIDGLLRAIKKIDEGFLNSLEFNESISRLKAHHSVEQEMLSLKHMMAIIDKI